MLHEGALIRSRLTFAVTVGSFLQLYSMNPLYQMAVEAATEYLLPFHMAHATPCSVRLQYRL
jgi:hypothetical protein